jgi:hypothetical protein
METIQPHPQESEKVERTVNQAKLRSYRHEPFWKFGAMILCTHNQAGEIYQANGNCLWQESEATEMKQLADYKTFIDKAKDSILPDGYKRFAATWYMTSSMMDTIKADLFLGDISLNLTQKASTLAVCHYEVFGW